MKVAFLAGGSSIHTIRWVNALVERGVEVHLFTQQKLIEPVDKRVFVYKFPNLGAVGYFFMVPAVKKILSKIRPDVVNAHYASGYGTTARLVGFRPWILSVWGSDVYVFPYKSKWHKKWLSKNLLSADVLASTGENMACQVCGLLGQKKEILITPFGVDVEAYGSINAGRASKELVVGTVKGLAHIYGIDILIKAFSLVYFDKALMTELACDLRLRIVGDGVQRESLVGLVDSLGLANQVDFIGRVRHNDVPTEMEKMDVFMALSRSESFGVAAIEASAAGLPVIVSNVGGFPEVVLHEKTGLVVPAENARAAASALREMLLDEEARKRMGAAGREFVFSKYSWGYCLDNMISSYQMVIDKAANDEELL